MNPLVVEPGEMSLISLEKSYSNRVRYVSEAFKPDRENERPYNTIERFLKRINLLKSNPEISRKVFSNSQSLKFFGDCYL